MAQEGTVARMCPLQEEKEVESLLGVPIGSHFTTPGPWTHWPLVGWEGRVSPSTACPAGAQLLDRNRALACVLFPLPEDRSSGQTEGWAFHVPSPPGIKNSAGFLGRHEYLRPRVIYNLINMSVLKGPLKELLCWLWAVM